MENGIKQKTTSKTWVENLSGRKFNGPFFVIPSLFFVESGSPKWVAEYVSHNVGPPTTLNPSEIVVINQLNAIDWGPHIAGP